MNIIDLTFVNVTTAYSFLNESIIVLKAFSYPVVKESKSSNIIFAYPGKHGSVSGF